MCASPHRASIDFELASGGASYDTIGSKYALSKDSVARHKRGGHAARVPTAIAKHDGPKPVALVTASADLANSEAAIHARIAKMLDDGEKFFDRHKATGDFKEGEAAFKVLEKCIRLVGEMKGMFPKAATTVIDARSVNLSGLDTESLKALAAKLALEPR